jgi:Tol biopolymer transport system component
LTTGAGSNARASASADGHVIAYHSQTPKPAVIVKDLRSGRLTDLGIAGSNFGPAISPDGTRVVYESAGGLEITSIHGGSPRTICQKCQIGDWSTDGRLFLVVKQEGNSGRLASIDIETGTSRDLVISPAYPVNRPFLSPDHQWLAFRTRHAASDAIMLVRVQPAGTPTEKDWLQLVADELDVRPCGWSPDGTLLYFVSSRDGTRCLYVLRIDRNTGKPLGDPVAVRHFHGTRNFWAGQSGVLSTGPANAVRGGFFLYDIGQYSSNIWTMSAP